MASKEIELDDLYKFVNSCSHTFLDRIVGKEMSCKIVNELIQYKKIEEELGIDLPTLIKAQTQGFYIKDCLGISRVRLSEWRFNLIKKEVHGVQYNSHYYFKDYGKTWALTKEELL